MERSERGLRPVPAAPGDAADASQDDALFSQLAGATGAEELPRPWLALQCRLATGCRRGLLLLGTADRGPYTLAAAWPDGDAGSARALREAAEQVLSERKGCFRAPAPEGRPAALDSLLVAEPVLLGDALHGAVVLEVARRPDRDPEDVRSQLRLGLGWLDSYSQRLRGEREEARKGQLEVVLGLVAAALEHGRFQGAATTFVTELANELGCDRVSVGFRRRNKVRVRALSHSAAFGKRTNLIRCIEASMDEALDQGASISFPTGEDLPRAAHAHSELARQFGASSICTVALVRAGQACGAVTLERNEPFERRTVMLLEVVAALAGPVLEDRRREDRFIGTKLLDSIQSLLHKLFGAHHIAAKLIALGIAIVALAFTFVTAEFRVTADATLEPELKRAAVAPFDGYVDTAPARAGDIVQEGELLASLDDRDLQLERVKWDSQLAQASKQYRQALAERDAAEVEIQAAAVDEARAELTRIEDRLARTQLRAPFPGFVVAGDLTQQLGSPVQRGDVLFEVAPLDAYRIEMMVDEGDIADVHLGQSGSVVLSALPEASFTFVIDKITPVSEAQEGRNTFRVEAHLRDDSGRLRPGLQGVAKISVERRLLVWIWTHDAIDWLRLKLWSWTP